MVLSVNPAEPESLKTVDDLNAKCFIILHDMKREKS